MLDLRRLALICEFARRGSIAATASSLGYSPSAVSQQLAALEREAGTALLDRTARSAELTDAGRRLVEHAERILSMVEAAETDLSAHAATPSGRVTVTAFPTAAVAFAPALARSLRRHSALSLRMRQGRSGRGMRELESGEVDIALVDDWYGRVRERESATLRVFPLLHDPLVLVVPRRHRMADPDVPVDLAELRDEPWMATPDGEPSRLAVDRLLAEVGGARPVPWEFEGLGTILSLVAKGIGIAAVPALALAAGVRGIVVREFPGVSLGREVHAVARASGVHRPSVSVTIRAMHVAARVLAADLEPLRLAAR
ncbi:DNA-binding transcriptional LysR family regulator [Thermocatellispora tengchongensis]|uniref:DNA-binding transcriptional LysR family regulator n=1 Tax=Thermocatellispora tengchongensis TaxID=1073253 RepID=A0A840NS31_9ACTN|nr:LysR family transcriptional regulator [Thermocatellispora tengchongensis]MBB5130388.1 DNA-binding transcriptional LysR family regulator [Thermocatellispora tengchongensis]